MIWLAVRIALPNAPAGNSVANVVRPARCDAAWTMSPSTLRMCASALLLALARGLREPRAAQELLGVGEGDGARSAARERTELARADDHAVRGERSGHRLRRERAGEPPFLRYVSLLLAVSQISIERKCERLASG